MDDTPEGSEMCRIAMESAIERGMDMCDDAKSIDMATRPFFGLDRSEDIDSESILEEGLTPASGIAEVTQWAHCRTNQLVNEEDLELNEAMKRAWEEADEKTTPNMADPDAIEIDDSTEPEFNPDDIDVEDSPL